MSSSRWVPVAILAVLLLPVTACQGPPENGETQDASAGEGSGGGNATVSMTEGATTEGATTEGATTEGGTAQPATTPVPPGGTGDPARAVSTAPGTPNPATAEKPPTGPDSVVEVKPVTPPVTPPETRTPAASSPALLDPALLDPALLDPALATEKAPDAYRVKLETSKGDIVIQVTRAWAPHGADRFYNLVKIGFYDGVRFFKIFPGQLAQFGISGNPAVSEKWRRAEFPDDPPAKSNVLGSISMAKVIDSENSATTQVFINIGDNSDYDEDGFTPFGMITEGLDVVGGLTSEYGDGPPSTEILDKGNSFLLANFPKLDFIKKATILE